MHRVDLVREFEQPLRAGQQPGAEVGGEAETVDVEVLVVDELGELVDVLGGEEAGLVDDQVVQGPSRRPVLTDEAADVGIVGEFDRGPRQPDPGGDGGAPGAVVADQQQPVPALPRVVVIDLQREGRLPAVHRAVEEHQPGRHRHGPAVGGGRYRGERTGGIRVGGGHERSA